MTLEFWRRLLPGIWCGWLLCVAILATPAPFAVLGRTAAGPVVARMLAAEAYSALLLGTLLLALERLRAKRLADAAGSSQFSAGMALAGGALFLTVAGYFGLQPQMEAAKLGQGSLSFGQLHALSAALFGIKLVLVATLAWRAAQTPSGLSRGPSS